MHVRCELSALLQTQVNKLFEWKDTYSRTRLGVTGLER